MLILNMNLILIKEYNKKDIYPYMMILQYFAATFLNYIELSTFYEVNGECV